MQPIRTSSSRLLVSLLATLFAAACSHAARSDAERSIAPHLTITNATYDSIVALDIAEGGGDMHHIALQLPLRGGLNAITVDVPAGPCLRDVHVRFGNGRVVQLHQLDLCRAHHLRLTAGLR